MRDLTGITAKHGGFRALHGLLSTKTSSSGLSCVPGFTWFKLKLPGQNTTLARNIPC